MWRNFLAVTLRSIKKNKLFNLINIAGLAIGLVSRSVVNAVGISIAIAMPVAYFMMRDWLRGFPYNVGFQPLLFISAAILVIIISMITVTVTSLRAARTDPAICLHYE